MTILELKRLVNQRARTDIVMWAHTVVASCHCDQKSIDAAAVATLGGGGGVFVRLECPTTCTAESCKQIGDEFEALFKACNGNSACEAEIQALYELALTYCEPA